jgi:hypothetical protein
LCFEHSRLSTRHARSTLCGGCSRGVRVCVYIISCPVIATRNAGTHTNT